MMNRIAVDFVNNAHEALGLATHPRERKVVWGDAKLETDVLYPLLRLECDFRKGRWHFFVCSDNPHVCALIESFADHMEARLERDTGTVTLTPTSMCMLWTRAPPKNHHVSIVNMCRDVLCWLVKCRASPRTMLRWMNRLLVTSASHRTAQWYRMLRLKAKIGTFSLLDIRHHFEIFDGPLEWVGGAGADERSLPSMTLPKPSGKPYALMVSDTILNALEAAIDSKLVLEERLVTNASEFVELVSTDSEFVECGTHWAYWICDAWRNNDVVQFQWALSTLGAAVAFRHVLKVV